MIRACIVLAVFACCRVHGSSVIDNALKYASKHITKYDNDLVQLASIPSVSSLPEHAEDVERAAAWLSARMKDAGLEEVQILSTDAQPAVYAQWLHAPGAPTVLIYGHFDVQPVDPLNLWKTPPFEAFVDRSKGFFHGRGVSDDKGGLLQPLHAVDAFLKGGKSLPVNVKVLLEGQEEIGSPNLSELLRKHKKLLAVDFALSADGGQISETQAGLALGLRGGVAFQVDAQTVAHDLHSGMKGGSVQNPIHALASFISNLHAPDGSVAVQGFYDGVREITEEDKADLAAFPFNEAAEMRALGALGPHGEAGYSTLERRWLRPTLEVVGMWGGFQGTGIKTIVPSKAFAKISCRLVPDQDPDTVMAALKRHVAKHAPARTKLRFTPIPFRAQPYIMPRDTLGNRAAAKVLGKMFGSVKYYRDGGSIPALALFKEHLGVYMTCFSFGLPDDSIHAPNESFRVTMWDMGRVAWILILQEIADMFAQAQSGGKVEL